MAGNGSGRRGSPETLKKLKLQLRLAVITIAIGVVITLANMYVESEPGAIPLLVVILGIGWYIITLVRLRSHHT